MNISAPIASRGSSHNSFVVFFITAIFLFASSMAAPALHAQDASMRVETFTLKPNGSIQVENSLGATRVETWSNQSVRIVAEKKGKNVGPLAPSEVMMMSMQNTIFVQCKQLGQPSRIDLTIYVPPGARLQVTGGAWPIEVSGSLAGAVVVTTSGDIEYKLPANDDASIAMQSLKGAVRSTLTMASSEPANPRRLQGKIGIGASPVILNSQSGKITLSPAPYDSTIARAVDVWRGDDESGEDRTDAQQSRNNAQGHQQSSYPNAQQQSGHIEPDETDPFGTYRPSPARQSQPSNPSSSSGRTTVFAGSEQSESESVTHRGGPFTRPREERNTNSGSSGIGAKIIPSREPLNSRQSNPQGASRTGNPDPQSSSNYPSSQNSAPGNTTPTSGNGTIDFAGSDQSQDEKITYKGGPFTRPREERNTNSGSSGLRVRIIPSGRALGDPRDTNDSIQGPPRNNQGQGNAAGIWPEEPTRGSTQRNPAPNDPGTATGRQPSRQTYDPRTKSPGTTGADDPFNETASNDARRGAPPVLRRSDDGFPSGASAQPETDAEETARDEEAIVLNASLVNLNVTVTDRSGVALEKLRKEDFEVQENNQLQSIEYFAPSTAPFNLVLVLDLSGSIQDKLDVVKSAALRFLEEIGPNDRVAVIAFTHEVQVISQLTSDRDVLRQRIKSIEKPVGGTAFYEVMWWVLADTLRGTEGQRNAIVVMTDGVDSSLDRYNPAPTRVNFNQLARQLEESDVIVFPIYLDTEYEEVFERGNASSESYALARIQLEQLAELTGGQIFHAEKVKDLSGVYKKVGAAIRTVYSVGYYSTNPQRDGTFRRVRVHVNRSGAAVRTRKGYYAK